MASNKIIAARLRADLEEVSEITGSLYRHLKPLKAKRDYLGKLFGKKNPKGEILLSLERASRAKMANIKVIENSFLKAPLGGGFHTGQYEGQGLFLSPIYLAFNHNEVSRVVLIKVTPAKKDFIRKNKSKIKAKLKRQLAAEYRANMPKIRSMARARTMNDYRNHMAEANLVEINEILDRHLTKLLSLRNSTSARTANILSKYTNSDDLGIFSETLSDITRSLSGNKASDIMVGEPEQMSATANVGITLSGKTISLTVSTGMEVVGKKVSAGWTLSAGGGGISMQLDTILGLEIPLNKQAAVNHCIDKSCGGRESGCDALDEDCNIDHANCLFECYMNS